MTGRSLRLILNGKKAGLPEVRNAVAAVREDGHKVEVRVTWEAGDAGRFAVEALDDGVDVIVAGGGDGTINEVVNGIFNATHTPETMMGVMPLGSANDFAHGCRIPLQTPTDSLRFTATAPPHPIDVGRINEMFFVNALVGGFGAEVTFKTSERVKSMIHGAAYGLTGFLTALKHTCYHSRVRTAEGEFQREMIFSALANGYQAGGFHLAPRAKLDDGLFDLMSVPNFGLHEIHALFDDIENLSHRDPSLVHYQQVDWMEVEADREIPISPDGEVMSAKNFRIDVLPQSLKFVLPDGPLLGGG